MTSRIAVLGDGLVGRTLLAAAAESGQYHVDLLGHDIIDVTNPASLEILRDYEVAINTVAYHRLRECEDHPQAALHINAVGAENVAKILPTVYISTDYVFDGKAGPYDEVMPGSPPPSVYGRTKLMGEIGTLARGGVVVRVASLFGHFPSHKGMSFPERVSKNLFNSYVLPHDQWFSPTYVPDIAPAILRLARDLGSHLDGDIIYHTVNSGEASWYSLAKTIDRDLGCLTGELFPSREGDPLRPANSVLNNNLLPPFRNWQLALRTWEWMEDLRSA